MCLLIKVAADTVFPFAFFQDVHESNPDGTGIMYVKDGQVVSKKELTLTAQDAYAFWIDNAPHGVEYAMHFRMKTHGAIDVDRVHPYKVNDDMLLMHNGVLSSDIYGSDADRNKSDTQMFAEQMGAQLGDSVYNPAVATLLGAAIGQSNRFIYAHAQHGLLVVNEDTGVTTERFPGCWFSNTYAWTPQRWGVQLSWGRGSISYPSSWRSQYESLYESMYGDDADNGMSDVHGFSGAKKVDLGKPAEIGAKEIAEMIDGLDEVEDLCEDIVSYAIEMQQAGDLAASRFLQVYGKGAELYEHVRLLYPNPDDALSDLMPMQQYLEVGQASYDDILDWLSLEGDSGDNQPKGEEHPNATYAG